MAPERDPDDLHNSMRTDDMPPKAWTRGLEIALPQRGQRTEEEAERDLERLRVEAEKLYAELKDLVPSASPPTLPDDPEKLEKLCVQLRQQIGVASVPTKFNAWLSHRFERRTDGSPMVCTACRKTLGDARGRCRGKDFGRY